MANPDRDTTYRDDTTNRTVYTRRSNATGWFVGIVVALALLAIGFLVFNANTGPATGPAAVDTTAPMAPADPMAPATDPMVAPADPAAPAADPMVAPADPAAPAAEPAAPATDPAAPATDPAPIGQ